MKYSSEDTEWAKSSNGDFWRRFNGKLMVVGTKDDVYYWARIDGDFLKYHYLSPEDAQEAADVEVGAKDDDSWWG